MRKTIITISMLAAAWAMPMYAAGMIPGDDASYLDNHAGVSGDSVHTNQTVGDSVSADTATVALQNGDVSEGADIDEVAFDDEKSEGNCSHTGIYIWLALMTAGVAGSYVLNERSKKSLRRLREKIGVLENAVNVVKSNPNAESLRRIEELNEDMRSANAEINTLRQQLQNLQSKTSRLSSSEASTENTIRGKNARASVGGNRQEKSDNAQVFYVDTLNVSGDGTLTIPMQVLKDADSGELFKVEFDIETGTGKYTLNPNVANMSSQLSRLQKFSTGLDMSIGKGVTVVAPGELRREGYDLVVLSKLTVKSV